MQVIKTTWLRTAENGKRYIEAEAGSIEIGAAVEVHTAERTITYPMTGLNRLTKHLAGQTVVTPASVKTYTVSGAGSSFTNKDGKQVQRFYI